MDVKIKEWIDNATYEQLLSKWRNAHVGHPYFQGEVGDYYKQIMEKHKQECSDPVAISKRIGHTGE